MFLHRIHIRLILLFVGLVLAILIAAGLTLQWTMRQSLETELGRKLEAAAGAASVLFRGEEIRVLLSNPGPRTKPYFQEPLTTLKEATGVERIYFFNPDGSILLDTEDRGGSETPDFGLRFYRKEMDEVLRGGKAHSILFTGMDGQPTMTGFAPFFLDGKTAGGVGVDGSAVFLDAVGRLKRRLVWIGLAGVLAALAGAALVSTTITRPIRSLAASSARIGGGRLDEPIRPQGKSELALLAKTMEDMRKGLIDRERELKAMLAGVAHEIRNPLGGIELFTGLLSNELAGQPEAQKRVDRILNEAQSLKQIVNSFLEFAGPQESKKEMISVGTAIQDGTVLISESAARQNVSIVAESSLNELTVNTDPLHFKRIVLNLLQNAVQAMPKGGTIRISGQEIRNRVRICFADSGPGIPEEIRDNVFTPFFTTREKGTGLGLSIVRKLLEINGGSVELTRSGPEGTEFCITLEKGHV